MRAWSVILAAAALLCANVEARLGAVGRNAARAAAGNSTKMRATGTQSFNGILVWTRFNCAFVSEVTGVVAEWRAE